MITQGLEIPTTKIEAQRYIKLQTAVAQLEVVRRAVVEDQVLERMHLEEGLTLFYTHPLSRGRQLVVNHKGPGTFRVRPVSSRSSGSEIEAHGEGYSLTHLYNGMASHVFDLSAIPGPLRGGGVRVREFCRGARAAAQFVIPLLDKSSH